MFAGWKKYRAGDPRGRRVRRDRARKKGRIGKRQDQAID